MEIYTDKLINEVVNEELSVSDEVSQLAWKLAIAIKEDAFKKERKKIASGVSTNVFLFNLKPFGAELQLKAHNTFFGDRKIYAEYRSRNRKSPNVYRKENRTLDMFFDFIGDYTDYEGFQGAIYHELKHLFQDVKSGGGYKNRPNYQIADINFNSKSIPIKTISEIIYYATDRELYAFAGQAYEAMMSMDFSKSPYTDVREAIMDTNLYKGYQKLKNGKEFLNKYRTNEKLNTLLQQFGVNFNQIMEHCEWAIKEYAKYIGRVIVKSEKDILERDIQNGAMVDY